MTIPARLASACRNKTERVLWLHNLPGVLRELQERWSLQVGNPFDSAEGSCAWVAPVTRGDRSPAILKLGMPHMEGEHEIDGLRFWDGNPTVQIFEADDNLNAMLLERCEPGTNLRELPEPEQDVVIAGLLRRLWRPAAPLHRPHAPLHRFRPLSVMTTYWSSLALARAGQWSDPGLTSEGLRLFGELTETAPENMLLATDLHAGNVLRAQREPWLAIDPKPFVGDPAYDATQHLFNCYGRLRSNPNETIRRFAGLLGLDYERVRLWTFARAAVAAGEEGQDERWIGLARALVHTGGT